MKVYVGTTNGQAMGDWRVWIEHAPDHLEPLPHIVLHSPDGFAWGYEGSGPSELARCLLIDVFGEDSQEVRDPAFNSLYHRFKRERIAPLNIDRGWRMGELSIRTWMANAHDAPEVRDADPQCPFRQQHVRGQRCPLCHGVA